MRRFMIRLAVCAGMIFSLCGCSVDMIRQDEGRQLDFTVVSRSELPDEVEAVLDEKLGTSFQTACQYEDSLYLLCGYPLQKSGGYSIKVNRLSATKDAVYFQAELEGTTEEEQTDSNENQAAAPWIAVKTEYLDLPVIFEPQ